jgi:hypothetical protein
LPCSTAKIGKLKFGGREMFQKLSDYKIGSDPESAMVISDA